MQCAIRHLFHAALPPSSLGKCSGFAILLFSFLRFWIFILAPPLAFPYTARTQSCLLPVDAWSPRKPCSSGEDCSDKVVVHHRQNTPHHIKDPKNYGHMWPLVICNHNFLVLSSPYWQSLIYKYSMINQCVELILVIFFQSGMKFEFTIYTHSIYKDLNRSQRRGKWLIS